MSTVLFPVVQPETVEADTTALPMAREVKWDFAAGRPVFARGEPVLVEGAEAVLVWAWNALQTPRFRHEIYTWAYGCELDSLIGQPFTEELKQAEAQRFVREALEPNPYITATEDITVAFSDSGLQITCRVVTIYGEQEVYLNV